MTELYKGMNATLDYGHGIYEMVKEKGAKADPETFKYEFYSKLGAKVLEYKIHEIRYVLRKDQIIQSLTIIYKNRLDGHFETLLDTEHSKTEGEEENKIVLGEFEEIDNVKFYLQKSEDTRLGNRLVAFTIKTNLDNIHTLGNIDKGDLAKDDDLETRKKIVFGFGVHAGKNHGVTGITAYYMDKSKYGLIQYEGLLQFRAKLKANPDFKKTVDEKKGSLDEKHKLLLDVCDLPETAFFPIASYIISI